MVFFNKFLTLFLIISLVNFSTVTPLFAADSSNSSFAENIKSFTPEGKSDLQTEAYMSLILMVGVGVIVKGLIASCVGFKADTIAAAGASVIYLSSEIKSVMDYDEIEFETISLTGDDKNAQKAALEKQKKMYEVIKETQKDKKGLQKIAAAGFAGAAAIATYKHLMNERSFDKCLTALKNADFKMKTSCSSAASTTGGVAAAPACAKCTASLNAMKIVIGEMAQEGTSDESSVAMVGKIKAKKAEFKVALQSCLVPPPSLYGGKEVNLACSAWALGYETSLTSCRPKKMTEKVLKEVVTFQDGFNSLNILFSFLLPMTIAGVEKTKQLTTVLGLGAAGTGIFLGLKSTMAKEFDLMMAKPKSRAIAFGALGILAYYNSTVTDSIIEKMDSNITELDKILKGMKTTTSSHVDTPSSLIVSPLSTAGVGADSGALASFGSGGLQAIGDSETDICLLGYDSFGNCKSMENYFKSTTESDMPKFDTNLQKSLGLVGKNVDKVTSGVNVKSGSIVSDAKLLNKLGAFKANNRVEEKLNKYLKKKGKKPTSFEVETASFLNRLKKKADKYLGSRGINKKGSLSNKQPSSILFRGDNKDSDKATEMPLKPLQVESAIFGSGNKLKFALGSNIDGSENSDNDDISGVGEGDLSKGFKDKKEYSLGIAAINHGKSNLSLFVLIISSM